LTLHEKSRKFRWVFISAKDEVAKWLIFVGANWTSRICFLDSD